MLLDIKEIKNIIQQIAELKQLPEESLWKAVENAYGAAYKREYAKHDQIIRAHIDSNTGETKFFQVKTVLSEKDILEEGEVLKDEEDTRVRFNPERHIMFEEAQLVREGSQTGEEIFFELEEKADFGRIAAQSARQAVTQKIHEAERDAAMDEFEGKQGTIVNGQVQRIERGNVFVDLGRTVAILPFEEQIRGERFRQGENIRAYVVSVDKTRRRGGFVRLSRAHPQFVVELFSIEVPELSEGSIEVIAIARDAGNRTKIAVKSNDDSVDPIGSFVGQRGVRVMGVKSELGGEQIDIIHALDQNEEFIAEALLPAEVYEDVELNSDSKTAIVQADDNQIPIAIGRGGLNLRLAADLTKWTIELVNLEGEKVARCAPGGEIELWKSEKRIAEEEEQRRVHEEEEMKKNEEELNEESKIDVLESSIEENISEESKTEKPEKEEKTQ